MKNEIVYDYYSASDYLEHLLLNDVNKSESVYYLLKKRLVKVLFNVFQNRGYGLGDEFEDTVDDFFLYLYDGGSSGAQKPFAIMESVHDSAAFFGWVVGTYRNFLLNKAREAEKRSRMLEEVHLRFQDSDFLHSEETLVLQLATAIAYADQQFLPRNLFVCYRMLLSILDHARAIPQEMMALALDMHPVTYRVCSKRQKDKLGDLILLQEYGQVLDLDPAHITMRDHLMDGFNRLYRVLMEFYDKSLNQLPSAPKIRMLRQEYGRRQGMTVHEDIQYGHSSVRDFIQLFRMLKLDG